MNYKRQEQGEIVMVCLNVLLDGYVSAEEVMANVLRLWKLLGWSVWLYVMY